MNEWNQQVIEDFRRNAGKVEGNFSGAPLLLLTTTGAKTGRPHTNPLMYLLNGKQIVVFASKGGAPTNPDWYHNLIAHPKARIEMGEEEFEVTADLLEGEERDRLYAEQSKRYPQFGEYQAKTLRTIPVIALSRLSNGATG